MSAKAEVNWREPKGVNPSYKIIKTYKHKYECMNSPLLESESKLPIKLVGKTIISRVEAVFVVTELDNYEI